MFLFTSMFSSGQELTWGIICWLLCSATWLQHCTQHCSPGNCIWLMDCLKPSPMSPVWDANTTHLPSEKIIYKSEPMWIVSLFSASLESKVQLMVKWKTAAYPCMGRQCFLPRHIEINGVCVHLVLLYRADKCTAVNPSKQKGRPALLGWCLVWVGH